MPTLQPTPPVHPVRRLLAAGSSGRTVIEVPGTTFRITEATGPVAVKIDDGGEFPFALGMAFTCPNGTGFQRIEVQNLTAAENTVEVLVTAGTITDDRLNVIDGRTPLSVMAAPTVAVPGGFTSIEALGYRDFPGIAPAGYRRREALYVSNLDTVNPILIKTTGGDVLLAVFPRTAVSYPCSGPLRLANDTGNAVSCYASELWHV